MNIVKEIADQIIPLLNNMAVVILVADVFSRTKVFNEIASGRKSFRNNLWIIGVMSCLSIYGTLNGIKIMGNVANIRNIGPMIAGFMGGPLVGVVVGIIGGMHRFFMGGNSAFPCAIAAILAGLFSGLIFKFKKGHYIGIYYTVLFAAGIELMHSTLVVYLYAFFDQTISYSDKISKGLEIEVITTLPRVLMTSIGMGAFAFISINLRKTRNMKIEKEKAERELKVARDIQMSIVPKIFPTFPDNKEVEIYANIEPAKEVAGDFYDFFFIDDRRICFSIGDVADKGVPSSLFMAVTKTLLKAKYEDNMTPADLLYKVNNELCEGNDSMMFVTVFLCILDLDNGEVQFANGGHNLPYKFTKSGCVEQIQKTVGPALGVMPNATYENGVIHIKPDEGIFLYTDGVNEAENIDGGFFGYDRLVCQLKKSCGKSSKEIVNSMNECITDFCKGLAYAHDDVTINVLRYFGKEEK